MAVLAAGRGLMYTLLNPKNGLFCSYELTVYEVLLLVAERSAPVILLAFLRLCHSFLASGPIACFKSLFSVSHSSFYLLLPLPPLRCFQCPEPGRAYSFPLVVWPEAGQGQTLAEHYHLVT